jgi:hypothetical protein
MIILEGMREYDSYITCRTDVTSKIGFTYYKHCFPAIRMLVYGVVGDFVDEYLRMSETTFLYSRYNFYKMVLAVFDIVYLREPNAEDTAHMLSINEARGFPGMIGSID